MTALKEDHVILLPQSFEFTFGSWLGAFKILGFEKDGNYVDTVTVGGEQQGTYSVYAMFEVLGEVEVEDTSPVVPLPAAAWGGMMLLGGIGAARLRRRKA